MFCRLVEVIADKSSMFGGEIRMRSDTERSLLSGVPAPHNSFRESRPEEVPDLESSSGSTSTKCILYAALCLS